MANKFLTIVEQIGSVIAWPFVHASRAVSIIQTTMRDYPAVRAAVIGLVQQVQTNIQDAQAAMAADGLNIPADVAELKAAKALYDYAVTVFLPALESAYQDEVAAAQDAATQAATKAAAASAAAVKAAKTRAANASPVAQIPIPADPPAAG